MPEVIRRSRESVRNGPRFNIATSERLGEAIRARAKADGYENAVAWCRDQLAKLVGHEPEAPPEPEVGWIVGEGGETTQPEPDEGDTSEPPASAPVTPKPSSKTKVKREKRARAKPLRPAAPAAREEPTLLQLVKEGVKRFLR